MKKYIASFATTLLLTATTVFGQDILPSQVPSVIANSFSKEFPKASDIEWEIDGQNYRVEFEIGWSTDHEVWYDAAGNMLRHEEEISKGDLPKAVTAKISTDFPGLRIDGIEKITQGSQVSYAVGLENFSEEWKVILSDTGEVLHKTRD